MSSNAHVHFVIHETASTGSGDQPHMSAYDQNKHITWPRRVVAACRHLIALQKPLQEQHWPSFSYSTISEAINFIASKHDVVYIYGIVNGVTSLIFHLKCVQRRTHLNGAAAALLRLCVHRINHLQHAYAHTESSSLAHLCKNSNKGFLHQHQSFLLFFYCNHLYTAMPHTGPSSSAYGLHIMVAASCIVKTLFKLFFHQHAQY